MWEDEIGASEADPPHNLKEFFQKLVRFQLLLIHLDPRAVQSRNILVGQYISQLLFKLFITDATDVQILQQL